MIENYCTAPHLRLKLMREALCLSKKEFSKLLNINYRTYNRYEKQDKTLTIKGFQTMVNLHLNPGYLFGDNNLTTGNNEFEKVKKEILNNLFKTN